MREQKLCYWYNNPDPDTEINYLAADSITFIIEIAQINLKLFNPKMRSPDSNLNAGLKYRDLFSK